MFYNTGIATYIWVLSNRKAAHRQGKVQLIDATRWFRPLRKNLGSKNCELASEDIRRICDAFLAYEESEQSKVFPNEAFGYWKVTVERPLRLAVNLSPDLLQRFRAACRDVKEEPLANVVDRVATVLGAGPHPDFNRFMEVVVADASAHGVKLTAKRNRLLQTSLAVREKAADPVIKRTHRSGREANPMQGLFSSAIGGKPAVVEYEPDPDLRDTEQVPAPRRGRHRGVPAPRGHALCPRRLVCARQREGRIRDQLHPPLLQAPIAPSAGRHPRRHPCAGAGDGGDAGRDTNDRGRKPMKATEANLLVFLQKSPQFVIPIYQRTYSWTESQCRQFWDDIIRTGGNDEISAHFIGSIVYIEQGLYQV